MSNGTLLQRLRCIVADVRAGSMDVKAAAQSSRHNCEALEGLAYAQITEASSIWMDLEIAHWHEEEGGFPDLETVLSRAERWLSAVPTDI